MKACLYARVSTLLGQDPENQLVHLRKFAESRGYEKPVEYVDIGVSGAKESRPALNQMVADAKAGLFQVLIVSGIDRIGRNTRHILNLIHELSALKITFISLRENLDFSTPVGQATLTILSAVASLERDLIKERIRNALAAKKIAAKRDGTSWRCGRPTIIDAELTRQVMALRDSGLSIRAIALKLDSSPTTVARILRTKTLANPA